jgi:hypothetical protein
VSGCVSGVCVRARVCGFARVQATVGDQLAARAYRGGRVGQVGMFPSVVFSFFSFGLDEVANDSCCRNLKFLSKAFITRLGSADSHEVWAAGFCQQAGF